MHPVIKAYTMTSGVPVQVWGEDVQSAFRKGGSASVTGRE